VCSTQDLKFREGRKRLRSKLSPLIDGLESSGLIQMKWFDASDDHALRTQLPLCSDDNDDDASGIGV
jgi:hypothetical protein